MTIAQNTIQSVSFTLGKTEIATLKTIADVAPKRPSKAILGNVLLTSVNGTLIAEASDLGMYARAEIANIDGAQGVIRAAIPVKQIKSWKPGVKLTLTSDGKYSANGFSGLSDDVDAFPKFPDLSATNHQTTVSAQYFADFLSCSTHASTSEVRPVLQAVCHRKDRLISTDGLRMLHINQTAEWARDVLVPAEYGKLLHKLFGKTGANMAYDAEFTRYDSAGILVYVRNISGNYPDTDRIWPSDFNHEGTISDTEQWLDALETAVKVAGKDRILALELSKDNAHLSVNGADGSFSVQVPYSSKDPSVIIHCNPLYLLNTLEHIGDGAVIRVVNDRMPFVITDLENRAALVSPVLKR